MKYQYLKLLFIEVFLIAFSFFHFFFIKQLNSFYYIIELVIILAFLLFLNKVDKKESYQKKEVTLIIVIGVLAYYIFTYFSGLFLGFIYTTYSRSIIGVLRNVVTSTLVIIIIEYIREIIVQKGKYYKSIISTSIIVTTLLELLFLISIMSFHSRTSSLEITMVVVFPCLFRNIFLTYCTYYFGKTNSIIYHLSMMVITYIVPIFPNLGDYVSSIILILHPLFLMVITAKSVFFQQDKIVDTFQFLKYEKIGKYVYSAIIILLLVTVYLVSDLGNYTILAIGSDSMQGTIDKGDIVIIDKHKKEYKKGDIIAFYYNEIIIVHRIVEIQEDKTYITKGDANNFKDGWVVKKEMIKGSANNHIKYIGWPTVKLSEYLAEDNR